jgi:RimJ/RimL family protein N-acetyltransferase
MTPPETKPQTIQTPRLNLIGQSEDRETVTWNAHVNLDEPAGECGFYKETNELFCSMKPEYRNKGIATEAVSGVLSYGFLGLGITGFQAAVEQCNYSSKKVIANCGAMYTRTEMREVGAMMIGEVLIYRIGYTAFKNSQRKMLDIITWQN